MSRNDDRGERLGSLELVPKEGEKKPVTGKSVFTANTRSKGSDRRTKSDDRRDGVRMTEPRRTKARRPKEAWDDVHGKR
jgi:hypothetical protein